MSRQTVFTYRDTVVEKGVEGLLERNWGGARKPAVSGAVAEDLLKRVEEGKFRQARDAQAWIKKRTRKTLSWTDFRSPAQSRCSLIAAPKNEPYGEVSPQAPKASQTGAWIVSYDAKESRIQDASRIVM